MSSSELSELSSSPLTDDDEIPQSIPKGKLEHYFQVGASALPPKLKKKRAPSPPHEYVLADNPDIAFICMFRSRFSDAFSKSLPHYGPQDLERGVIDSPPGEQVERLLCALLGLLLNRKKEVERGHYSRALEEAIQAHKSQWAVKWEGKNPLHGGGNFNNMTPEQRLTLLRTLILWSLDSSDIVKTIIKDSYKQSRHDDDLNQPLSIQPWGRDGEKRRFWLVEGQDNTHFRLYRESNPALKTSTWRSMAGDIDEVRDVAKDLKEEGSQAAVRLHDRIMAAIPRFEASEDKRKRRDYRLARRAQFTRPEPGFSLYEGRTRGKRPRYTYSDDDGGDSDAVSAQHSVRQSGISTPAEPVGPTFTASGRQVKSRHGGAYGESMLSGKIEERASDNEIGTFRELPDDIPSQFNWQPHEGAEQQRHGSMDHGEPLSRNRPQRTAPAAKPRPGKHIDGYNELDEMDDESDAPSSGNDWDSGAEDENGDEADDDEDDDDVDMSNNDDEDDENATFPAEESEDEDRRRSRSLVVSLRYSKIDASPLSGNASEGATTSKHEDGVGAPKPSRTSPSSSTQDTSNTTYKTSDPASEGPRHLPPTFLPTTTLPPISIDSLKKMNHKLPETISEPGPQPHSLGASLPATTAETLDNPQPYTASQETHLSKIEPPSIDFHQYQYQPPKQ